MAKSSKSKSQKPSSSAASLPAPTPLAGRYAGAAPAVSLGNQGGMTEIMARAVQANPGKYSGYANPYGGGSKKGYYF